MANLGRNDRCPCGSGRKYKRCCLQKDNPTVSTDLPWKQVRAARDSLNGKMLKYSLGIYDKGAMQRAWDDWCGEFKEPFIPHGSEFVMFMSWFLVNWLDHDPRKKIPLPPLSWKFRTAFKEQLSPIENEYLNSIVDEPFSYFEILDPKPGEGYLARDILTGREMFISEKSGSKGVYPGSFLFGRLAKVGDITIFDAISETLFPLEWKTTVIEARQNIKKDLRIKKDEMPSAQDVRGFEFHVRILYRDFRQAALNPQAPQLTNTDGEPISFNKVIFAIEDADQVFEAIHPLCFNRTKADLLEDAALDALDKILTIEFPWLKKGNKLHKEWDNTIMGNIIIERGKLTVDTNSLERVEAIKSLVAKHCGKLARHESTLIEPLEAKLAEMQKGGMQSSLSQIKKQEELRNHPEIQAQMKEMHKSHMERWITEKIPALGGKTPIQAVKTPEGKEMVEALLMQFERGAGVMNDKEFELGVLRGVRQKLGLALKGLQHETQDSPQT